MTKQQIPPKAAGVAAPDVGPDERSQKRMNAMKLALGVLVGFFLAALFAPWSFERDGGKTETCIEHRPWLMSKKYLCTPAEAEALRKPGAQ